VIFSDGINNDFEEAHQKGLQRGFDLGWTYKGRFDRSLIREEIEKYNEKKDKKAVAVLQLLYDNILYHDNNRENITINSN
jgi:hypothetical protein